MAPSQASPPVTWAALRGQQGGNLPQEFSSLTFSPSPNRIQKQDLLPLFPPEGSPSSSDLPRRTQRRPGTIPLASAQGQPTQKSIELLQNLFPHLPAEHLRKELIRFDHNVDRCAEFLLENPSPPSSPLQRKARGQQVELLLRENPSVVQRREALCSVCGIHFGQDLDEGTRERVYTLHRAPTRKLSQQMEKFSKLASRSYAQGKKALAKEASEEKERIQRELASLNHSCSLEIFTHFNYKYLEDLTKIDLHGLHSEEATYFVTERLSLLRFFDVTHLTIITGVGNHSLGRSVIHPAIVALLEQEKLGFDQSRAGQIVVRVRH